MIFEIYVHEKKKGNLCQEARIHEKVNRMGFPEQQECPVSVYWQGLIKSFQYIEVFGILEQIKTKIFLIDVLASHSPQHIKASEIYININTA